MLRQAELRRPGRRRATGPWTHATGRYVFFVGSDDHLGPEALERLVAAADRYGSDVVLGRMVGVNSRYVAPGASTQKHRAATSICSTRALPWSLSNTKLFRRELIERHGLRYPEDMPVGSDQPFTTRGLRPRRRISVLADYDYYYAVRGRTPATSPTAASTGSGCAAPRSSSASSPA